MQHITLYHSKEMYSDMLQLYHNIPNLKENNTIKFVVPKGTTVTSI